MQLLRTVKWVAYASAALLFFGSLVAVLAWLVYSRQTPFHPPFSAQDLSINIHDLYDMGVVDLNRDGNLDLFTSNHNFRQSLLISDGEGGYTDQLTALGLDQDYDFPGLEPIGAPPDMEGPGLYVYFFDGSLLLHHVAGKNKASIGGSLVVPIGIKIKDSQGFDTTLQTLSEEFKTIRLAFSSGDNGKLSLGVPSSAPLTLSLSDSVPLDNVYVGSAGVNPKHHDIELYLKDRHGIAWADVSGDSVFDLYISRGANSGRSEEIAAELSDQYLESQPGERHVDRYSDVGFKKNHCPGRQVAWTDINNDNRLDLYVSCGRRIGGAWEYLPAAFDSDRITEPNMLFVQNENGSFEEAATEYGLDFEEGGTFRWFDVDTDGDIDLLWASKEELTLYRNSGTRFVPEVVLPESTTTPVKTLAAADFDKDGDTDIFAAAAFGSRLLVNDSGMLQPADPAAYGLPSNARTAAWVDYNNDGNIDLYAWPGGIFQQQENGYFEGTGLLQVESPYWMFIDPRVIWFDYDNDGDRDVIVAQRYFPRSIRKKFPDVFPYTVDFLRNDIVGNNNWIQLELHGPNGNREAIGATVTLITSTGSEVQQVGQSDSSHYSQGHYRLYFGLGQDARPQGIEVRWPGNSVQMVDPGISGQLKTIVKQSAAAKTETSDDGA